MNQKELRSQINRLYMLLFKKWTAITEEMPSPSPGHQVIYTQVKWRELCESLGIEKSHLPGDYFPYGGMVLEETVVVSNPSGSSEWLEMTHETATMILTLGMP